MARPKGLLMITLINCKKGHMFLRQLCTLQCSDDSEIKTSVSRSVTNIYGRPPRKNICSCGHCPYIYWRTVLWLMFE